jgi:site-specific DNA recombinase
MTEIAAREGMKVSSVAKLLPLAFLAPDVVEAILVGHQAPTAVAHHLIRSDLPMLWQEQRGALLSWANNEASCGPEAHIGQS